MRSSDTRRSLLMLAVAALMLAATALLAGCSSIALPESLTALVKPAAAPAPAATASAPVATPREAAAEPGVLAGLLPPSADAQRGFDEARRQLAAGRSADAERTLRALLAKEPKLAGAHANLGLIQRQAGRLDEAAASFERAVQASPRQPVYFNQLGITYRQMGRFDKARRAYEQALSLDDGYAAAHLNYGVLLDLYVDDAPGALAQYERYLALTPGGDATVAKWVTEVKTRKPRSAANTATNAQPQEAKR